MSGTAAELAHRLARDAEAVCQTYLSNGRRTGGYWSVGDVKNTPGRSLYVRLYGPEAGRGAAGHWTDAATGAHGDLLDLIQLSCGLHRLTDALDEARRFLALPQREPPRQPARPGSAEAARRLFAMSQPIRGTLAATYLHARGLALPAESHALRFHGRCFHVPYPGASRETWPALVAPVTDLDGAIAGVMRTWLARDGSAKAPLASPRRALGHLLGHGVRFGAVRDVLLAGEGLETVLSLRTVLPDLPAVAALSANNLAALVLPPGLRRFYVARDNDAAGLRAAEWLCVRAEAAGIDARCLVPTLGDFNDDLRAFGTADLSVRARRQLWPEDAGRFASCASPAGGGPWAGPAGAG